MWRILSIFSGKRYLERVSMSTQQEPIATRFRNNFMRAVAIVMGVGCAFGALNVALSASQSTDPGFQWGMVGIMVVISAVCILALFDPTNRRQ
jgi:hypothetical protein